MARSKKNIEEKPIQKAPKVKIKPLMGYLLVEPQKQETKTMGGLYIPETASQERPAQGVVVSVGDPVVFDGREFAPPVEVGMIVIYKKWGGEEIKYEGKDYKLVKFDDLMAVIEE